MGPKLVMSAVTGLRPRVADLDPELGQDEPPGERLAGTGTGTARRVVDPDDGSDRGRADAGAVDPSSSILDLALRVEVAEALGRGEPLRARLRRVAAALVDLLGARAARIWTARDGRAALVLEAGAGRVDTPLPGDAEVVPGVGPIGRVAAGHQPQLWDGGRLGACAIRSGGELLGAVAIWRDQPLTLSALHLLAGVADAVGLAAARARVEAERERLLAESRRNARLMEVFVGVLSHDLRNPLGAIAMAGEVLARQGGESDGAAVKRLRDSVGRMQRMIDQLLDFTRIRLGEGLPLSPQRMDVSHVAHSVVAELQAASGRAFEVRAEGDLWGVWDRDRLAQLMSNLGGNACQHGGDGPVSLALEGLADTVRVGFENEGVIPDELLPELLEPGVKQRHSGGLGLGLYIAQQIAAAHGGRLEVSCAGGRTRVTAVLPRRPPPAGMIRLERISG